MGGLLFATDQRVVSLLPSHTEILVALGGADDLVAVSDAERPNCFPGLPRVGGVVPRWEPLVALAPTLVLADDSHKRYLSDFQRFSLPVSFFPATRAQSIDDVFKIIRDLGKAVGRSTEAEKLLADLQAQRDRLPLNLASEKKPKVFFEVWPHPLQAVGGSSLQGRLLDRAGFENIVPDTRNEMPLVSAEWVVREAPDWIFFTDHVSVDDVVRRPGWGTIPAVREGRVIALDGDLFSRAGPRIIQALEELIRIRRGENLEKTVFKDTRDDPRKRSRELGRVVR